MLNGIFFIAGEYPSTFFEAAPEFHVQGMFTPGNSKGTYVEGGNPLGLYRLILGEGQNAFVANGEYMIRFTQIQIHGADGFHVVGLGGTSQLNANVFLPADKKTLSLKDWPTDIRNDPECLDKCKLFLFPPFTVFAVANSRT